MLKALQVYVLYNVYSDVLKQIIETISHFSKTLCTKGIHLLTVLPDVGRVSSVFESLVKDILYLT